MWLQHPVRAATILLPARARARIHSPLHATLALNVVLAKLTALLPVCCRLHSCVGSIDVARALATAAASAAASAARAASSSRACAAGSSALSRALAHAKRQTIFFE